MQHYQGKVWVCTCFPSSSSDHPAPSPTVQQILFSPLNFLFIHTQCLSLKSIHCTKITTGFAYIAVIQDINNQTVTPQYLLILSLDFPFHFVNASLAVVWSFTWQKSGSEWTPPKKKSRLSSQITMKTTVQINIFTKCLKLAMLQGTRLGSFFPLFCQDNLHRQTCSRAARKVPWNTFCCSTGKVMWHMNRQVQDKSMFGQHPASNGFVVLGINKFRGMDPGQQKNTEWDHGVG